jgi:hypothetical protein
MDLKSTLLTVSTILFNRLIKPLKNESEDSFFFTMYEKKGSGAIFAPEPKNLFL